MVGQNVNIEGQNVNIEGQNVNIEGQNVNIVHSCHRCSKVLATKKSLNRHISVCDGTMNSNVCSKCNKSFSCRQSKSRHLQNCKGEVSLHVDGSMTQYNNSEVNNIQTQNNIENQQNIQTQNNNNITIVTFNPEDVATIVPLLTDHIDIRALKAAIKTNDKPDVLLKYTEELMKKPENRCVKKTNMRSSHSSVHVGNNKWRLKPDALVYPKLVSDIATLAQDLLEKCKQHRSIPQHLIQGLIAFNEYIADKGYCNEDSSTQDRVMNGYKRVVSGTKSLVYENTQSKT